MERCCDLEVDVNGEETFVVDKDIIASYSGRLRKLLDRSKGSAKSLKVIFHDFPGGAEIFELMLKFCYGNCKAEISPSNACLLHFAAQFMEMDSSISVSPNLLEQTQKSLEEISFWTWSELLRTLKHCEESAVSPNSSTILEKCLDSLVGRLTFATEASPCPSTSSPDSFGFRFSTDTKSTESLKTSSCRSTCWFDDLLALSPSSIEVLVKHMIFRKFDHVLICKFLIHYQKSKFFTSSSDEKRKVMECVIGMLYVLDKSSVSCKTLFGILRVSLGLNISKGIRNRLEGMIGSRLNESTLDNLLVPSPSGMNHLYDVNLVLRLVKAFLRDECQVTPLKLKKVASLIDLYMAEVAPDSCLKPSKFVSLAMVLPDSARDSYDDMYRALDIYLQVHAGISQEEKMKICCSLNYEKLSKEVCIHLSKNQKFPPESSIQALLSQQPKPKSLHHAPKDTKSPTNWPSSIAEGGDRDKKDEASGQVVLYAGKLDLLADNENLRARLEGMQWRVMELEKACKKMQTQMAKIFKSKPSGSQARPSFPRLCS